MGFVGFIGFIACDRNSGLYLSFCTGVRVERADLCTVSLCSEKQSPAEYRLMVRFVRSRDSMDMSMDMDWDLDGWRCF